MTSTVHEKSRTEVELTKAICSKVQETIREIKNIETSYVALDYQA